MSKIYIDTEFIEDGSTIKLLSIALVHESNASYYAEMDNVNWQTAPLWVKQNVIPHLGKIPAKSPKVVSREIERFIDYYSRNDKVSFYGWYSAYDWVAFCQLYGTMRDLPKLFPQYCNDLKQTCDELGNPNVPTQSEIDGPEHFALSDARWNMRVHNFLTGFEMMHGRPKS